MDENRVAQVSAPCPGATHERSPADSLYAAMLGPAWSNLHPAVQQAHAGGPFTRRTGQMRTLRGSGWLARLLLALLRWPATSASTPTQLLVRRTGRGELWTRRFGRRTITTTQHAGRDGVLCERLAPFEFGFRLRVEDGGLVFQQVAAAIALGSIRAALPRCLWPRVAARESAVGPRRTHVRVSVELPLVGRLFTYEGHMQPGESP
jgi:hypothetical protein